MQCTRCARALDAQALELGACRYCGQAIPDELKTVQNTIPGAPSVPGSTSPTLPKLNQPPAATAWNETANDAPTQFGPLAFPPPGAAAPLNVPAPGTAPFAVNAPAPSVPPPGGAFPQQGAYPPFSTSPAQYPPAGTGRKGGGKTLLLAILAAVLLVALIGGGVLFARGFNKPSANNGTPVATSGPNPTTAATPRPTATPTAKPTSTSIPTSTYRDPNGLFSIQYPTAWPHANFSPSGTNFPLPLHGVRFSSGQAEFVILTGQEGPLPTSGLAAQADDALLGSMNAQNVSSASSVQIGGQTWTEKSADTDGGKHTVIASISLNGFLYSLWYSAPTGEFSADEQQVFNPMVASFRFG
jgi:hypothetical protein